MNSWRMMSYLVMVIMLHGSVFLSFPLISHAVLYAPGETLDPSCAPTDVDCGISSSIASSTANSIPYYAANGSTLSATSALVIATNGNVGIGTTSPSAKLTLQNTSDVTGTELVTNGSFTGNANSWTLDNCAVYGSNAVTVTYASCDSPNLSTTFTTTAGGTYLLTFTLSGVSDETVQFWFDNNGQGFEYGPFSSGTYTIPITTDFTGSETITFSSWNWNDNGSWTIDNVSIKSIPSISPALSVVGYDGSPWLSVGGNLLGNTSLGRAAGSSNTSGTYNSFIGANAGQHTTTGANNSFMGAYAGFSNTTGYYNAALGTQALLTNTTGGENTAIGAFALSSNSTGSSNTAVGSLALSSNTTGIYNTALGRKALLTNSTGSFNTAAGQDALRLNTTGYSNTAIGQNAMWANTTGYGNTVYGAQALRSNSTGVHNTVSGFEAGSAVTTGSNNIFLGYRAGDTITTGARNILIGYDIDAPSTTGSSQLSIGNLIYGTGLDGTGTTLSSGNIGIGSTTPNAKLSINSSGSNVIPLAIKTNGSVGNYTTTNSAIFMYNAAGTETLRIVSTDPNINNYNSLNLYIGYQTGYSNPTDNTSAGYGNNGFGAQALYANTTGDYNSAFGLSALQSNTSGTGNSTFGNDSLYYNTTGNNNAAFGVAALGRSATGDYSSALGTYSLYYQTTGAQNTSIGGESGYNPDNDIAQYRIMDDTNVTLVGYGATKNNSATITNAIAIGSGAHVLQSNQAVLGNDSILSTLLKGDVSVRNSIWANEYRESSNSQYNPALNALSGGSTGAAWIESGSDAFPVGTTMSTSLVYDGKIWMIGGRTTTDVEKVYYSKDAITWIEAGTNSLPTSLQGHTSLVYDGKMWIIGGWAGNAAYTRKVYFSTDGVTWTEAGSDALPVATGYHNSVVYDGKMWVISGYAGASNTRKVYYSTNGSSWTEVGTDSFPAPMTFDTQTALVYDNKMWTIGGYSNDEGDYTRKVYYSTDGITWTESGTNALPVKTDYHKTLVYDNKMWVLGGDTGSGGVRNVYYSTDGITWTESGTNALPVGTWGHGAVVFDGKMWIISGHTTTNIRKVYYTAPTISGGFAVTNSTGLELFQVSNSGNVGIGTTTPSYTLHVGNSAVSGVVSRFENSTGYCDINPTTTSLTCTSDERLKKNILTLEMSATLEELMKLEAVTYNWLSEDDTTSPHAGFIAQDVRLVFPDLVSEDPNGTLSVSYGGFIPYIIDGIKEMALTLEKWKISFTSTKITTDTLCVLKSDGAELCVTGDDLEAAIKAAALAEEEAEETNPPADIPTELEETLPVTVIDENDTNLPIDIPTELEEDANDDLSLIQETPQDIPSDNEDPIEETTVAEVVTETI